MLLLKLHKKIRIIRPTSPVFSFPLSQQNGLEKAYKQGMHAYVAYELLLLSNISLNPGQKLEIQLIFHKDI